MAFGFFRTVWISLRAVNYTTRAFQDTIHSLTKTQRAQIRFALNAKRNMMAVGMMYIAFGGIAVQTLGRIITASKYGERMMMRFGKRIGKSISKLGETMAKIIEPFIGFLTKVLEIAMAIPLFKEFVAIILLLGTAFLFVKGTAMVFSGVLGMLKVQQLANAMMTKASQTTLDAWSGSAVVATGATHMLSIAMMTLGASIGLGLGIFLGLKDIIGTLPAAFMAIAVAMIPFVIQLGLAAGFMSTLTWGAAAVAGGAAIAGVIAMVKSAASIKPYKMGTTFVRKGGLAFVHGGEEITSAREGGVKSGWGRRWETRQEFSRRIWNVTINMGDVHTRADRETMVPLLKRALKEELEKKV